MLELVAGHVWVDINRRLQRRQWGAGWQVPKTDHGQATCVVIEHGTGHCTARFTVVAINTTLLGTAMDAMDVWTQVWASAYGADERHGGDEGWDSDNGGTRRSKVVVVGSSLREVRLQRERLE